MHNGEPIRPLMTYTRTTTTFVFERQIQIYTSCSRATRIVVAPARIHCPVSLRDLFPSQMCFSFFEHFFFTRATEERRSAVSIFLKHARHLHCMRSTHSGTDDRHTTLVSVDNVCATSTSQRLASSGYASPSPCISIVHR